MGGRGILLTTIAVGVLAATAADAQAALEYAGPSGGGPPCTQQSPCSLDNAMTQAGSGGEVVVLPGTYNRSTNLGDTNGINLHGQDGAAMPDIVFTGAYLYAQNNATVRHLRIDTDQSSGIDFSSSTVDRVYASSSVGVGCSFDVQAAGDETLTNSVCVGKNGGVTLDGQGLYPPHGVTGTIRNVTAIATTTGDGIDMNDTAPGSTDSVTVVNSIAHRSPAVGAKDIGVERSSGGGTSTLTVSYSNYDPAHSGATGTGASLTNGGHNQSTAPVFVNAGTGDFHEAPSSTGTIDQGTSSPDPFDLDGNLRTLGAATDIGAYELVPAPCVAPGSTSSITSTSATLNGTVTPYAATSAHFLYGLGSPPTTPTPTQMLGPSNSPQSVSATLAGLKPNTTYHVHLSATNQSGNTTSTEYVFTTAAQSGGGGATSKPSISKTGKASTKAVGSAVVVDTGIVVGCPSGGAACAASADAQTQVPKLAAARKKMLEAGHANVTIAAGDTGRMKLRLTPKAARALKRFGHLKLTIAVTARKGSGASVTVHRTVTIKPPKKHKRH